MSKTHVIIGLLSIVALTWLIVPGNEEVSEPTLIESQSDALSSPGSSRSTIVADTDNGGDHELPVDWESVTVADCAHFGPPAAIEQAASINPHDWTARQLCAWMLANSNKLNTEIENVRQRESNTLEAQFPEGAFDSPYEDFSSAELELAAPNDGVASYVLATRLQHIDRKRSDELFIQSAAQTRLPGPLMAAVFTRDGVDLVRDPASGSVAYADPDDVFRAAVLAMTVEHMGYDFHQAGFFMEHVVKAMGPDSTNAVLAESQRLYEQISLQGAE